LLFVAQTVRIGALSRVFAVDKKQRESKFGSPDSYRPIQSGILRDADGRGSMEFSRPVDRSQTLDKDIMAMTPAPKNFLAEVPGMPASLEEEVARHLKRDHGLPIRAPSIQRGTARDVDRLQVVERK